MRGTGRRSAAARATPPPPSDFSAGRRPAATPHRRRAPAPRTATIHALADGMAWYGMVNVDLYSAIITIVPNALNTLVSGEKPGFYRAMLWY